MQVGYGIDRFIIVIAAIQEGTWLFASNWLIHRCSNAAYHPVQGEVNTVCSVLAALSKLSVFSVALHRNGCSKLTGQGWGFQGDWQRPSILFVLSFCSRSPARMQGRQILFERGLRTWLENCRLGKCAQCFTSSGKQTVGGTWPLSCLGCRSCQSVSASTSPPPRRPSPSCPCGLLLPAVCWHLPAWRVQKYCSKRPFISPDILIPKINMHTVFV